MRISESVLSKGCPVLAQVCQAVDFGDDKSIHLAVQTAEILIKAYGESDAIGLAAPQIGRTDRVCIIGKLICFNPRIVKAEGHAKDSVEGCLSVPGQLFKVKRFRKVWLEYQNQKGQYKLIELYGQGAACAQHEIDHLDGVLICDRDITREND